MKSELKAPLLMRAFIKPKKAVYTGAAAIAVFVGIILLALVTFFGWAALVAWVVMLVFGAIHSYAPSVPAVGFSLTFWVVVLFNVLLTLVKNTFGK